MRHDWQKNVGLCGYCHTWCPQCNDCTCPGKGWKRYASSSCPGFDTEAGRLRPERAAVTAARAEAWRDRNRPVT